LLATDPADVDALTELANQDILLATAYTRGAGAKRALYREAMKCCELAMYTHPGFRKLADEGRPPWEACEALTEREMGAMLFWVTALLYDFKDCMSTPARVGNIEWIRRAGHLLARMESIDPGWRGGVIPMSWSFYYYILPASMGGNVETARAKLEESVRIGPDRLLNRWARARFFRVVTGDRAGFVEDLKWVAAQSPDRMQDDPHWKAYIVRDTGQLLQDVDRYF